MSDYLPISDHGVIGDLRTVALVGTDGTIDWFCCPHFDSPSVFGAILDADRGGYYRIAATEESATSKQLYFPDTNVLVTRFLTSHGVSEVTDFMPLSSRSGHDHRQLLVRHVVGVRGEMGMRAEIEPRFNYARDAHEVQSQDRGVVFRSQELSLALACPLPLQRTERGVTCDFTVAEGQGVTFFLERVEDDKRPDRPSEGRVGELFRETVDYWHRWLAHSRYRGRWREMVNRSALVLKLLTFEPTGAIVAAPTTSLPEQIGGGRNWDYRYTWVRDAAFTVYAFMRLGFVEEAKAFAAFMGRIAESAQPSETGPLEVMYRIDGGREMDEEILDHLSGYRGSRPVRIGNGAASQLQLDIYGELMDSAYLFNKWGRPVSHDGWVYLSRLVDWVCENWDQPDEGIWETRGGRQSFVYSRLMSWVAVERAIRMANHRGLPADVVRWSGVRDRIYRQIIAKGWHADRGAFVQHYDTDVLDASLLMMPLVKFMAPEDPRWLSTLDRISEELVSDSLVYRYNVEASPDGLQGDEGTFSICTFWYVEALARAGRTVEARLAFEKMLTYANHLGLYSEEIGPTGEQLGNFPQAFTHLALISAAFNLDRCLGA